MLTNLNHVLEYGNNNNCAIAGFNVFGYEDAYAVVKAAENLDTPVILMANQDAVRYMPVNILGGILIDLAQEAKVPVCVHLDHSPSFADIRAGIEAGFTSVMLDASQDPLEENIAKTIEVVQFARPLGVSVESEVGSVGFSDPSVKVQTEYSDPETAKMFAEATKVDALAISIGNVHRMTTQTVHLQFERLKKIHELISIPLVLHGSSGIPDDELVKATQNGIRKVNIGTTLRMVFGNTLREEMKENPEEFDRIKLFKGCMDNVQKKAEEKMRLMSFDSADRKTILQNKKNR